jgi:hypothetical protein
MKLFGTKKDGLGGSHRKDEPGGSSKKGQLGSSSEKEEITQKIALVLLYTFICSVAGLFLVNLFIKSLNIYEDADLRKGWFDLLKNSLILLSTALTTVIGYYFGQREGALKAEQADAEAEKAVTEVIGKRDQDIKAAAARTTPGLLPIDVPETGNANSNIIPPK